MISLWNVVVKALSYLYYRNSHTGKATFWTQVLADFYKFLQGYSIDTCGHFY